MKKILRLDCAILDAMIIAIEEEKQSSFIHEAEDTQGSLARFNRHRRHKVVAQTSFLLL